jgi:hypothetical protein
MARRLRVAWLTAVAVLSLIACDTDDSGGTQPPTSEGPDVTDGAATATDPADYRAEDVRHGIRSVSGVLESEGITPRFAFGGYRVCQGGEADTFIDTGYAFAAQGRADYPIGAGGTAERARAIVSALEAAGWTGRDDDWAPSGIHAAGSNRWSVYASRDGLDARVDLKADDPVVLMSVTGPCLVPADGTTAPEVGSSDISLPGAGPLGNGPTENAAGEALPGR